MAILIFGGGFYGGTRATQRVLRSSPEWLQKAFGVSGYVVGTATPTSPANPLQTPAPSGVPTSNGQSVPNPDPMGFPGKTTGSAPAAPTQEESPAPQPLPNDKLGQMVSEYNLVLRRMQENYANYESAKRVTGDPKAKAEEMERAIGKQSDAAEQLVTSAQRAQTLYDAIHGFSDLNTRYKETELALTGNKLPQGLPELSVDNLKFIRPR